MYSMYSVLSSHKMSSSLYENHLQTSTLFVFFCLIIIVDMNPIQFNHSSCFLSKLIQYVPMASL